MSEHQLALEWLGGATERRMRLARPGFDDLPWHTLDTSRVASDDPALLSARAIWTNGVVTEYASAAAFSALNIALLECGAPVDLCAAAADFAVDELAHVTLVARLVTQLGGASPYLVDLERIAPARAELPPVMRAAKLAIEVSCIGEALSLPSLAESHRSAQHPLARAVLERLRHDEGPHAAIGHWFLAWAEPRLTSGDREHLGELASATLSIYAQLWQDAEPEHRAYMDRAVDERIVVRLAKSNITCRA